MIIKDAVKSVLYISTTYNKGVGTININIAQIDIRLAFSELKI